MGRDVDGSRIHSHGSIIHPDPDAFGSDLDSIGLSCFGLFVSHDARSGQSLPEQEGMMSFQRISRL
jgi:hypothetical protein